MKSLPTHKFAYTNGKVTNITEYGTDGTEGNHLNISYKADNTTVFTESKDTAKPIFLITAVQLFLSSIQTVMQLRLKIQDL